MSDLISVCIPAYGKRFLAETLESLMKQDYRPFEIVIGDDRPDAVDEALLNAMRTDEGSRSATSPTGRGWARPATSTCCSGRRAGPGSRSCTTTT